MDEEFDTSLDTSSFDDITPDTSDIESFDEANDIVSVMDEAIDTNSFDTTENSDILPDTSDDIGSLMDEVPLDTNSIEELDIEENSLENEPEIESLMDDTDVGSDEIGALEVSDTPESDFSEELLEQSEVNEESADSSIDVDTETSDISDSDITEISEQESNEISDLMNETTLEDMPEETEIQDESEAFDMPHDEVSESENDISEIENIMSETEPALEESNDTAMSEGETYDIPHDDEVSENTDDINNSSEISDLMDSEDFSAETEQEINSEQSDIEDSLNDTGDNITESEAIELTDDRGPNDFESSPEILETPSQYETVGEFAPKQPGDPEAWDMSDVPSFEEHLNDTTESDVSDIAMEPTTDVPSESETSSFDSLYEYMSAHNYGREDFEIYSKDPEWQELNNAYRIEHGEEPIDYGQSDNNEFVEDMHDQVTEGWGIPEDSPEYEAIMQNEQDGLEDIQSTDIDSDTAISQDTVDHIDSTDATNDVSDSLQEADSIEPLEQTSPTDDVSERVYDDFETLVMQDSPDFYESGSFYTQGINEYGYEGTCGPTSQANALNKLFDTNEFTENKVLDVAVSNNLCSIDSFPEDSGGTTTEQFMELYDKMNEQLGGGITTELHEYGNALDVNEVAEKLDEGSVLNVAVDACALWDQPRDYVNSMGIPQDDFYSDHWITVTGVQRDDLGNVQGFDIIDSGGGVDYVSADKYHEMCFGTDEHKVIDPTSIVVSKNDVTPETVEHNEPDNQINTQGEENWFQRIFGRRNK